jgi:hypothetical protein
MNQSIEDAATAFSIEFEGELVGPKDWEIWLKAWQASRQSSQSEPVAVFRNTDDRYFVEFPNYHGLENIADKSPLFLAAPQQAIPSGWQLVPKEATTEMMLEAHKLNLVGVSKGTAKVFDKIYKAMLSASPTAPIERDKS